MKNNIGKLLKENEIKALVVSGESQHNPPIAYFSRGCFFTQTDIIIKQNNEIILFYRPMERDTAEKTGIKERYCYDELIKGESFIKQSGGDENKARGLELKAMLEKAGIASGKVAFCGRLEFGNAYAQICELKKVMPEIDVVTDEGIKILNQVRYTKDENELEAIRHMSVITTTVVGRVEKLIRSSFLKNGIVVDQDGNPLTIGRVKELINLWLGELGAENPEGTIFSMGKDAGVPHNSGNDAEPVQAGKSIVFDFFPCEMGGGYFYDFTRTWCVGYAPEKVAECYQQVKTVHDKLICSIHKGMTFKETQMMTCDMFEKMGHPTVKSNPKTRVGYVHSVGHGVGLNIHERPFSGFTASDEDILLPGVTFTIEPGLYYPEEENGFGVRIEDTLYMDQEGKVHIFTEYPYQLVLDVPEWEKK